MPNGIPRSRIVTVTRGWWVERLFIPDCATSNDKVPWFTVANENLVCPDNFRPFPCRIESLDKRSAYQYAVCSYFFHCYIWCGLDKPAGDCICGCIRPEHDPDQKTGFRIASHSLIMPDFFPSASETQSLADCPGTPVLRHSAHLSGSPIANNRSRRRLPHNPRPYRRARPWQARAGRASAAPADQLGFEIFLQALDAPGAADARVLVAAEGKVAVHRYAAVDADRAGADALGDGHRAVEIA